MLKIRFLQIRNFSLRNRHTRYEGGSSITYFHEHSESTFETLNLLKTLFIRSVRSFLLQTLFEDSLEQSVNKITNNAIKCNKIYKRKFRLDEAHFSECPGLNFVRLLSERARWHLMLAFTSANKSEHSRWPVPHEQHKAGQRNGKTTVILITHNLSDLRRLPAKLHFLSSTQPPCSYANRSLALLRRSPATRFRLPSVIVSPFFLFLDGAKTEADRNRASPRTWNNRFLEANRECATARFCIIGNPRACARAISLSELSCRKHRV